jgi:hypothetical protein
MAELDILLFLDSLSVIRQFPERHEKEIVPRIGMRFQMLQILGESIIWNEICKPLIFF